MRQYGLLRCARNDGRKLAHLRFGQYSSDGSITKRFFARESLLLSGRNYRNDEEPYRA
jgi:hypothetical protein